MKEIFNLSNIRKLVESNHPSSIIVIDTNIIMNTPDFHQWKTDVKDENQPIFVLSDLILIELQSIKGKKNKDKESVQTAREANKSWARLTEQGDIANGIRIAEVGWFISIPSPNSTAIRNALVELDEMEHVYGPRDTKFIILTRELIKLMPDEMILFATNDISLFNIAEANQVPACQLKDSTMVGVERCVERKKKEPLAKEIIHNKPAIGGLIGHSVGGKITDCHFKGKITTKGNSKDVDVGGLIGRSENTEIVNSSADAEIEYKQD